MPPIPPETTTEVDEQVREYWYLDLFDSFSFVYMSHAAACCVTLLCCCTATTGVDKHVCEYYSYLPFRFIDQFCPAALRARARDLPQLIMHINDSIKSLRESIPYIGPVVDVLSNVVNAVVVSVQLCS
jgi:hypothetical protein